MRVETKEITTQYTMTTEEKINQFKDTYQQVNAEIGKTIVGQIALPCL